MPHTVQRPEICIAGAGIIGLSLALELHHRGASVLVLESQSPLLQASSAAAGMLAADDPENPLQLSSLAHLSTTLYPPFLARIEQLGHSAVPFQTSLTLQAIRPSLAGHDEMPLGQDSQHIDAQIGSFAPALPKITTRKIQRLLSPDFRTTHRLHLLNEHSIDPRQLASALLAAVQGTSIDLRSNTSVLSTTAQLSSILIHTSAATIETGLFVDCTGAWASHSALAPAFPVIPIKGQMLSLAIPADLPLDFTVRTPSLYIVPRLVGPHAGRAIVGATIEDAGFDTTVHTADIAALHAQAVALIPALARAPIVDSWAGLRPASPDRLPLLGAHPTQPRHFVATAHYRNGILLAPATARVMADLLLTGNPSIDISAFAPNRFHRP